MSTSNVKFNLRVNIDNLPAQKDQDNFVDDTELYFNGPYNASCMHGDSMCSMTCSCACDYCVQQVVAFQTRGGHSEPEL